LVTEEHKHHETGLNKKGLSHHFETGLLEFIYSINFTPLPYRYLIQIRYKEGKN